LGWWNVQYICFCFGWPCTALLERENRSDQNIVLPSYSLPIIVTFSFVAGCDMSNRGFNSSDNFDSVQVQG
jgi:hypothetical protein